MGVPGPLMALSTEAVQLLGPSRMVLTALFVVHLHPREHGVGRERRLGVRLGGLRGVGGRAACKTESEVPEGGWDFRRILRGRASTALSLCPTYTWGRSNFGVCVLYILHITLTSSFAGVCEVAGRIRDHLCWGDSESWTPTDRIADGLRVPQRPRRLGSPCRNGGEGVC